MIVSWKSNQLLPTFDYTITVLNKLASRDTTTGKVDIWYATKLENCSFTSEVVRDVTFPVTSDTREIKFLISSIILDV